MAMRPARLLDKQGNEVHFKTSIPQVEGLQNVLAGKQGSLTADQLTAVNSGIDAAKVGKIAANETAISGINDALPNLASKDFVNSSLQTMSADLITYDAAGNPFPTKAALLGAETVYSGGVAKVPDEHDYCTVLADESRSGAQTRWTYSKGAWGYQFMVNDTPFTAEQNAAINSGVTAEKVAGYDQVVSDAPGFLKALDAMDLYEQKMVPGVGKVCVVPPETDLTQFADVDLFVEISPM